MMISKKDCGIFSRCIDLNIVRSYPWLSYIRPRRPRTKMVRRPRVPIAAVAAELVAVSEPVVGQSTDFQPQQPPAVAIPASPINFGIPAAGENEPELAAVPVEAVAVTAAAAPPEPPKKGKRGAKLQPLTHPDWLPTDWTVGRTTRQNGASAGNRDKYYKDPSSKRKFRSKPEVMKYLDQLKLNPVNGIGKGKGRRGNINPIPLPFELLNDELCNISFAY